MKMKCYKVTCRLSDGSEDTVGVMCSDEAAAKKVAEHSLREGKHIEGKAIRVEETDTI